MEDYHVISMDSIDGLAVDNGLALHVNDVSWAKQQMWAPDANEKDGKYYLFFPAKAHDDIFRIGVAVSDSPTGPFKAQPEAIKGSFSIDPAVFNDDDGSCYMYFGGLWGGQLQRWRSGEFNAEQPDSPTAFIPEDNEPALLPFVAKMTDDLLEYDEKPKEIEIIDENGALLLAKDIDRRFFEAAWMHKHDGNYYFSYSTGDNPYGPFTYGGRILEPVVGWTSHHSVCNIDGKDYLFYHDSSLSKGVTHLRSVKVAEINYNEDGAIITIYPYNE
jgi:hypothetical protein